VAVRGWRCPGEYRQAITAAVLAGMAAMLAERWLSFTEFDSGIPLLEMKLQIMN